MFCIYVCHFISRRGGTESSAGFRRAGAETTYNHIQMMKNQFPGIKVVVMGDMNDEPDDDSMSILLHGRKMISEVGEDDLFNPMWQLMIQGRGSSMHNHRWMMFDNILISHNLLPDYSPYPDHKLHLVKSDKRNFAMIFAKKFMLLRGRPKRSYEGSTFCGGYSDHLPIIITLRKS
jgi:endonuclease/exonuclease/phosphatase family metal-dependent hydrolase